MWGIAGELNRGSLQQRLGRKACSMPKVHREWK